MFYSQVNGTSVRDMEHQAVVALLKEAGTSVCLVISRKIAPIANDQVNVRFVFVFVGELHIVKGKSIDTEFACCNLNLLHGQQSDESPVRMFKRGQQWTVRVARPFACGPLEYLFDQLFIVRNA